MNNFWENILKYPRFFISSLIGLALVILTPIKNLLKIKKLRILLIVILILLILILYLILMSMFGM